MADRACQRCGRVFKYPRDLRTHLARKTPCAPILEVADLPAEVREDPELENKKCCFCGRVFSSYTSMRRHVRTTCKIAPNERNGDAGMETLYEHTLRLQEDRIAALEDMMAKQTDAMLAMRRGAPANIINAQQNVFIHANLTINLFGEEKTDHLTSDLIKKVMEDALVTPGVTKAVTTAVVQTAMLVYSDPEHPENLTCYLPNKKTDDALVRAEQPDGTLGWEIRPCSLVLPPMAQKTLDMLFDKQPFEDADKFEPLVQELRANEERYAAGGQLRPVLVRNKDLLAKALEALC